MENEEVVISVHNVSKNFVLPHERAHTVKSLFTNMFRRKKGAEMQRALRDISFEIKRGEFFGIVGRNGSGKSTLLKMLAGIYQSSKGSITVRGKLVPFIELGVGFNPELTGRENVYLNGALLGFSEKEIDKMYDEIVEFAELERFMDQKLKNYSSGMQVRLAFSMAVRADADILLIDEVLAVGDADFQRKCYGYFKSLKKNEKTVVFVSHDMDAVREYCDRGILLEKNCILQSGAPEKIAEEYTKLFSGDAPKLQGSGGSDRWGDGAIVTRKITAKITPEIITINQELEASKEVDQPIVGIRVRDASGHGVLGTNTKIENFPLQLRSGSKQIITWEMPNILAEGEYFVDPAVLHADGITVADWWDGAASFQINKNRHIPYPVDPGFSVTVKE